MNHAPLSPPRHKTYVTVTSVFDIVGYMRPAQITWKDGRKFSIDEVRDYRPAATLDLGFIGICYTVVIKGMERQLYYEPVTSRFGGRTGRWFVETGEEERA